VPARFFSRVKERLWGEDITSLADTALIDSIGVFFGRDFSAVRFRRGGILPCVVPFPYSAVVFFKTVNIRKGYESVLRDPRVMAEELFHVSQWARMGPIRISFSYVFNHLRRGYEGNPIENEAKERADAFCASLKSATQR